MSATRTAPLDALLDLVAARPGALVVFDLDDTLFSTSNRHLKILAEFADRLDSLDAKAAGLLRSIRREALLYSPTETVKKAGLADQLVLELKDFWFARFFKNPYLLEDDVTAGAPEFVRAVQERGGVPVYMTGRDESMREGTEASLSNHKFPIPDEKTARLILKPTFDTPDFAFKNEALHRLADAGAVAGSFENEPAHVNLFAERFPEGRHFLVETRHSGKPVTLTPAALRIPDFRR